MASVYALLSEFPSADTVANAHLNGRIFCLNGLLEFLSCCPILPEHSLLCFINLFDFQFSHLLSNANKKSRHEDVLSITA